MGSLFFGLLYCHYMKKKSNSFRTKRSPQKLVACYCSLLLCSSRTERWKEDWKKIPLVLITSMLCFAWYVLLAPNCDDLITYICALWTLIRYKDGFTLKRWRSNVWDRQSAEMNLTLHLSVAILLRGNICYEKWNSYATSYSLHSVVISILFYIKPTRVWQGSGGDRDLTYWRADVSYWFTYYVVESAANLY